ncbi:MAG: hypothetical protein ACPGAG_12240, partial [Paracoccaceae bacterium]
HRACHGNMGFDSTPITEKTEQQLAEFFAGERPVFDLPLALHGTEFTSAYGGHYVIFRRVKPAVMLNWRR